MFVLSVFRTLARRRPARWAALALCAATLAACSDELRSVPFVNGVVDMLDDGDEQNELGNPWEAIAEGAGTYADMYFPKGGYGESSHFLIFDGVRPADAASSQVVGIRTSLLQNPAAADPDRDHVAADVSAYTGLALAIKGTPGTYIVQLGSTLVEDFDYYNTYVEVGEEWSEFMIPFAKFNQEGFGRRVPWNSAAVSHVAIYPNLMGTIRFAVDNVRFY